LWYIQGPASTTYNAEIYLNFEVTPQAGSIIVGTTCPSFDFSDPLLAACIVRSVSTNICHPTNSSFYKGSSGLTSIRPPIMPGTYTADEFFNQDMNSNREIHVPGTHPSWDSY